MSSTYAEPLDRLHGVLDELAAISPTFRAAGERREFLIGVARAKARLVAEELRVLAVSDDIAEETGDRSTATWLADQTKDAHGTVRRDAALASALDSRWVQTADTLGAGDVNVAQARVIVEALQALPKDLGDDLLAGEQLAVHSRGPVVTELRVDALDLFEQHLVCCSPTGWLVDPLLPVVVARSGNLQYPAHEADVDFRVLGLLRTDVGVDAYRSIRRAKKASAFPKISSSCSLCASSRSSRRILAWSDSGSPAGARPAAASRLSAAFTQLDTDVGARLNSLPNSMNERPCLCRATIWSLNSCEKTPLRGP